MNLYKICNQTLKSFSHLPKHPLIKPFVPGNVVADMQTDALRGRTENSKEVKNYSTALKILLAVATFMIVGHTRNSLHEVSNVVQKYQKEDTYLERVYQGQKEEDLNLRLVAKEVADNLLSSMIILVNLAVVVGQSRILLTTLKKQCSTDKKGLEIQVEYTDRTLTLPSEAEIFASMGINFQTMQMESPDLFAQGIISLLFSSNFYRKSSSLDPSIHPLLNSPNTYEQYLLLQTLAKIEDSQIQAFLKNPQIRESIFFEAFLENSTQNLKDGLGESGLLELVREARERNKQQSTVEQIAQAQELLEEKKVKNSLVFLLENSKISRKLYALKESNPDFSEKKISLEAAKFVFEEFIRQIICLRLLIILIKSL